MEKDIKENIDVLHQIDKKTSISEALVGVLSEEYDMDEEKNIYLRRKYGVHSS